MRNRVPDEATCAICGRHFDPSETRGWCPNPSCGEWQHPSFPVEEGDEADETTEASDQTQAPATPTKSCPNCGNDVRADANFCKHCATQLTGEDQPQTDIESDDEGVIDECPDCGADLSGIPPDRLSTCPICMFDLSPVLEEAEEDRTTGSADTTALAECPNCGEDLTPIPEDMRTVCPGCRVDLAEGLEADTHPGPERQPDRGGGRRANRGESARDRARSTGGTDGASADPPASAGRGQDEPLDDVDHIAGGYVQRLSEVGVRTVDDLVAADPDTVSAKTGISARRIRGWVDDLSGDAAGETGTVSAGGQAAGGSPDHGSSGPSTGEHNDGLDGQETKIQRSPDSLVFEVMGKRISVTGGMTVGKAVRKAMVDAGAPEEDAVYVHRKHVRVELDDGEFVLTRLGENSLTVDGETVEKGEAVRIENGDEVGFSGVVTATVSVE